MKAVKIYLKGGSTHTFPLAENQQKTILRQLINDKYVRLEYEHEQLFVLVEDIQAIYVGKLEIKDANA